MSPEIESARIEGVPLITIVGIPFSALFATSDSVVGSSDDTACNHCPSTNSIEFAPTSVRLEIPGSMVIEDVKLCKSSMSGSVGLTTLEHTWVCCLLLRVWSW